VEGEGRAAGAVVWRGRSGGSGGGPRAAPPRSPLSGGWVGSIGWEGVEDAAAKGDLGGAARGPGTVFLPQGGGAVVVKKQG
jgi:hypothetical protein